MSMTDDDELREILLESHEGIAELFKSVAHPARIRLLALLLSGEHELSSFLSQTRLSKNALVNHLNLLIEKRLVRRVARGEYDLTADGRDFIVTAATTYRDSRLREDERREQLRRLYTEGWTGEKRMSMKVITKEVEYQPCWLSYTGAVAGCLRALGVECDTVDVGGRSGYAFVINVSKGVTCPSGPTALPPEVWSLIHEGTESLGWKMEHYYDMGSYPSEEGSPSSQDFERAKKLFEKVKLEVDDGDRPVVLWGLDVPEYGIVKGYQGNSYITSTYRRIVKPGESEEPILFYDLKAPGCLDSYFFRDRVERDAHSEDREALERALRFASAVIPTHNNYVGGPAALDEWADVLENLPEDKQNYHGNSYVGACVQEGRTMAAEFLRRLAKKYTRRQSEHLEKAAGCYSKGAEHLDDFCSIFPFKFRGDMPLEDRKKGAEILRKVRPLEEAAITHLKKALEAWRPL